MTFTRRHGWLLNVRNLGSIALTMRIAHARDEDYFAEQFMPCESCDPLLIHLHRSFLFSSRPIIIIIDTKLLCLEMGKSCLVFQWKTSPHIEKKLVSSFLTHYFSSYYSFCQYNEKLRLLLFLLIKIFIFLVLFFKSNFNELKRFLRQGFFTLNTTKFKCITHKNFYYISNWKLSELCCVYFFY